MTSFFLAILLGAAALELSSSHTEDTALEAAMKRNYGPISGVIYVYFKNEVEPVDAYQTLEKYGFSKDGVSASHSYQQKYHYKVYVNSGEFDKALKTFSSSPLFEKASFLYRNNEVTGHYSPVNPYGIGVDSSFAADIVSLTSFFVQHSEYSLKPADPALLGTVPNPNPEVYQMFMGIKVPPGSENLRCQEFEQSVTVARCAQAQHDTPPGALY